MILRKDKMSELPTGWELTQLGNVVDIHGGSTPSTTVPKYWKDGGILWATPTDITSLNTKYISATKRKISQKAVDETSLRLCEPGTLLMTSRATIGYPAIAEKPITTNQGFINIHCGDKVEALFLYYWITESRALLERFAQGSTFLELLKKDFRRFHIDLPPLPEQRKIAEILSAVDEAIKKTDGIINETQQLKKGLVQKLFTEGIGHTRFKETKIGRIPEKWEIRTLGTISKFQNGYAFDSSHYTDDPDNLVIIRMSNITKDGRLDLSLDRIKYFPYSKLESVERFLLEKGDLIIAMTDMSRAMGIIGHTAIVDCDSKYLLNQRVGKIIPDESVVDKSYLHAYTNTNTFIKYIKSTSAGAVQVNANTSDIKKARIPLPKLPEQRRIVEILSKVDAKIEKEQVFKSELGQLKKGLMQVLLTGKVRVKV